MTKILHKAGETVSVGDTIAQIEPGGGVATAATDTKAAQPEKPKAASSAEAKPKPKPAADARAATPPAKDEEPSSPDMGTQREKARPTQPEQVKPKESRESRTERPEDKIEIAPAPDSEEAKRPAAKPATNNEEDKPDETKATKKPEVARPAGAKPKTGTEPAAETRKATPPTKDQPAPEKEEPRPAGQHGVEGREHSRPAPRSLLHAAAAKPSADNEEEIVPMTMLRRTIARRLVEAQQTMAMLTTFNEVDMSAVQTLRHEQQEAFQKRYGIKFGLMSFFVKAAIDGLKQFPQLNAEVRGNDIVYRNYFDIGVAIATDRGLVVPVLRRAERLSFAEIEQAIAQFAQRAKENDLKPEDLEGGTFTITNGGVFGSLLSTPIINPPQSGILGLHTIEDRPVAREGSVVVRPMMYVALTYDHRIVDGREAVLFLCRVKEAIETPARMLIEV